MLAKGGERQLTGDDYGFHKYDLVFKFHLTVHSVILQVKKSVSDSAVIVRCDENH